jgi:anaerobic magnesium-protoporphyrin IX monomethyl ester cyclase
VCELLDAWTGRNPRPLTQVPGLCWRAEDGTIVRTGPREVARDLDAMPRPAWDLVDVERYRRFWIAAHGYFSMNIATTRVPVSLQLVREAHLRLGISARSPESVVDEIRDLSERTLIISDRRRSSPARVDRTLCRIGGERGCVPSVAAARGVTRPSRGRSRRRVPDRGRCRVGIAAEPTRWRGMRDHGGARLLRRAGIEIGFFLQFGYPGETRDDIEQTLQIVRTCRPDDIGVSVSYPLPGTPFYERVKAELGDKRQWTDSNDLAVMYPAAYPPAFYRALHGLVHAEFRARKSFLPYQRLRAWVLRRRVDRLARLPANAPRPIHLQPVLTPQAAAVPSEQSPARS